MIKKIFLIQPPAFANPEKGDINPLPPLGLGYIAAVLELQDIEVKIVIALWRGSINRIMADGIIRIGLSFF